MKKLGIHVIAGCIGESIVLELPNGKWGVVDCYSSNPGKDSNPTIHFLRKLAPDISSLEFVCLSHPHVDHLAGMDELLEEYQYSKSLGTVWLSFARESNEVLAAINEEIIAADESHIGQTRRDRLLTDFMNRINQWSQQYKPQHKSQVTPPVIRSMHYQLNYQGEDGDENHFEIVGISPESHLEHGYHRRVMQKVWPKSPQDDRKKGTGKGKPKKKSKGNRKHLAGKLHNNIGLALLIRYGKTQVLLGADLEKEAWEQILKDPTRPKNKVITPDLIKVSHHGSNNSFSESLFDSFAVENHTPQMAIITHYCCGKHPLPQKEAVEKYASTGAIIGIPNNQYSKQATKGLARLSFEEISVEPVSFFNEKDIYRDNFYSKVLGAPCTWPFKDIGLISVYLDHESNITNIRATPSAGFFVKPEKHAT